MNKQKVIDVSVHNGTIDFEKVKRDGITKAILRVGWIGNKHNHTLDNKFIENYNKCINNSIEIGIYVYSYCKSKEATLDGARWVLQQLNMFFTKPKLPIFLDLEDSTIAGIDKNTQTDIAVSFCEYIKQNGFESGVYANKDWFLNKLDITKLLNYKIWLAEWNNKDMYTLPYKVDLWQYTSSGNVNGITGRVDISYCMHCDDIPVSQITGETSNNVENGGFEMKKYVNGSTKEYVYSDKNCTKQIGYINPRETAECYGIIDGKALVVYNVDGTSNKKAGFVKWLGGVK